MKKINKKIVAGATRDNIYKQRLTQLRKIMKEQKLDLVLVYSSWTEYSYGVFFNGVKPLQYQYFFVEPKGEGFLVPNYILEPYRLDIHPDSIGFVESKLKDELSKFADGTRRVGIVGPAPATHLKKIKAELVFLDNQVNLLLARKAGAELKSIEMARSAIIKVLSSLEKAIKPGVRLDLLAKKMEKDLEGKVDSLVFPVVIYSDYNKKSILSSFGFPSKVNQKDLIVVDIGAEKNGLMADLNRTYLIGMPELKKSYDLLKKVHQKIIADLKIGQKLSAIPALYEKAFKKAGLKYDEFNRHALGISIGFNLMEQPYIGEGLFTDYKIHSGLAITLIPKILVNGKTLELQDTIIFK